MARDPVRIEPDDQGVRRPDQPVPGPATSWTRGRRRAPRALYLSSPIGLGHARRDIAIAAELRTHAPGPPDRLARPASRDPGARRRRRAGAPRVGAGWPTSRRTSSTRPASTTCTPSRRSAGWTRSWSTTSWCSTRWSRDEHYDLVIGDEAWDVDYFLHENPELKRFGVRLDDRLRRLAADAGRRRGRGGAHRRLQRRDDRAAGPLPAGCATGRSSSATPTTSSPDASARACRGSGSGPRRTSTSPATSRASTRAETADRERAARAARLPPRRAALRRHRRRVRRRRAAAAPGAGRRTARPPAGAGAAVPRGLRARGSIPGRCPRRRGARVRGYVPDLHQHLAACDLAVVQGGLTHLHGAHRRPPAVPLRAAAHHFEQNFHVRQRLERYGAGRCLSTTRRPPTPTRSPRRWSSEVRSEVRLPAGRDRRRRPGRRDAGRAALRLTLSSRPGAASGQ